MTAFLEKKINGNYTPYPEEREAYCKILADIRGIFMLATLFGATQAQETYDFFKTFAIFVYDFSANNSNKINQCISKIEEKFADFVKKLEVK